MKCKQCTAFVLTLVLLVSALTLTAGAAFTDAGKIKQTVAVDQCVRLGFIQGFPDGSCPPKGTLTREQMCKMLSVIANKGKTPARPARTSFKDVSRHSWSAPYIQFCANKNIVNGVGNGRFNPQGKLDYLQASKMLLVLMAYNPNREGMTGSAWAYRAYLRAEKHNLYYRVLQPDLIKNITREDAAQMIYNTINAPMIGYSANGKSYTKNATVGSYYLGLPGVTTE